MAVSHVCCGPTLSPVDERWLIKPQIITLIEEVVCREIGASEGLNPLVTSQLAKGIE
jgi:hypothetical protein